GWAERPQAARIKETEFEFRLWPALFGNLILPLVAFDQPEIFLVRGPDGRTNWDNTHAGGQGWKIPAVQRFLVRDGHVEIDDAVRRLKFLGTISSQENAGDKTAAFQLKGTGTLNGNSFLADVQGGPLIHVDQSRPYKFNADIHAGA